MRKFIVTLLVILVLCQALVVGASAANYTYTVRVFSGNHGSFGSDQAVTFSGLAPNQTVSVTTSDLGNRLVVSGGGKSYTVTLDNKKYYIQGIRLSGRDNYNAIQPYVNVEEDADYVVAYGIRGDLVQYTVEYRSRVDGSELAESSTYYGNVGEKPVVAFLYVDGYTPEAYNATKTLKEDVSANVFTFWYNPNVTPEAPAVPTPTPAVPVQPGTGGGTTDDGGDEANNAAGGNDADANAAGNEADANGVTAPEDETEAEQEAQEAANAQAPTQIDEEQTPAAQGPAELIDLDEDDTPLGNLNLPGDGGEGGSGGSSGLQLGVSIGVLVAALSGLGAFIVFLVKKQKEEREQAIQNVKFTYNPYN